MEIFINGVHLHYVQYGKEGGTEIVLLHGWGQNIEMMKPLGDLLSDRYHITILDLPGFGNSSEPPSVWKLSDYVSMLEKFISSLSIEKPILMGHSFGGRVAIQYSSNHNIKKLVLFGSPCIRKNKELPLSVKILKSIKKLPGMNTFGEYMKKYIGSRDYKAASPKMRQILVETVNEDLSSYAKQIEEPTLLIWGDHDTEEPVENAKELETIMPDAGLVVLPGSHFAYLENLQQVVRILKKFMEDSND